MNIYFSCSITGGRQDEAVYQGLVDALLADGHEVPTAILSRPEIVALEAATTPRDVYLRDIQWVVDCDALVAEVSTPSHGVGYEIALAVTLGKPVLCCYHANRRVSKMLTGNDSANLSLLAYHELPELLSGVRGFLRKLEADCEQSHHESMI